MRLRAQARYIFFEQPTTLAHSMGCRLRWLNSRLCGADCNAVRGLRPRFPRRGLCAIAKPSSNCYLEHRQTTARLGCKACCAATCRDISGCTAASRDQQPAASSVHRRAQNFHISWPRGRARGRAPSFTLAGMHCAASCANAAISFI